MAQGFVGYQVHKVHIFYIFYKKLNWLLKVGGCEKKKKYYNKKGGKKALNAPKSYKCKSYKALVLVYSLVQNFIFGNLIS